VLLICQGNFESAAFRGYSDRQLRNRVAELENTLEARMSRLETVVELKDKEILRLKSQLDKNSGKLVQTAFERRSEAHTELPRKVTA
jgi:hypothetical protein